MAPTRIGIPPARFDHSYFSVLELEKIMTNLFCQIYIGGLRSDSDKYDVEEAFAQYGKVLP